MTLPRDSKLEFDEFDEYENTKEKVIYTPSRVVVFYNNACLHE